MEVILSLHKLNFLLCQGMADLNTHIHSAGSAAAQFEEIIVKCNIFILQKQDEMQYRICQIWKHWLILLES